MSDLAEISLQWKGTDACYDLYCPCNPDEPQHWDGLFGQWFTCGSEPEDDRDPDLTYCGKIWWLPNRIVAIEVPGRGIWPPDPGREVARETR